MVSSTADFAAPPQAADSASAASQRTSASEPQMVRGHSRLLRPSTIRSASTLQDRSLNRRSAAEPDSIYAERGRSASADDVHGNAIGSKCRSSKKKSTRKTGLLLFSYQTSYWKTYTCCQWRYHVHRQQGQNDPFQPRCCLAQQRKICSETCPEVCLHS